MITETQIETALYSVLQDAPVETVIRCLGRVCHDIEQQNKRSKKGATGTWAMLGDALIKLAK